MFSQNNELTHEVYFETDKYVVPETEQNRLLLFIQNLDTTTIEKIAIYGFCDDRGSHEYNLVLSQNRANAIKKIFSNNGIDESIISNVDGKGEVLLKLVNTQDANIIRGLNRKVEIIINPKPITEVVNNIESIEAKVPEKKLAEEILQGELKVGDKIVLDNILFKTGYSYIVPGSKKTLEKIAKILKEREDIYFQIHGHVCCTQNARDAVDKKTRKRNLSVARAKYIYDYLAKRGVDKRRMKYIGMRRKFPLGGEAKYDRRVEILITYISDNKPKVSN